MYFIKTKGTGKIPDYIQLRDDDFSLISYFKPDKLELNINKLNIKKDIDALIKIIEKLDYGEVKKI